MHAELATIERTIDAALATVDITKQEAADARRQAHRTIAGFEVFDEAAEKAALDSMIKKRRDAIEIFQLDRKTIRDKMATSGLTPLAVVPTRAWQALCKRAGLFLLAPDDKGRVRIDRSAIIAITDKVKVGFGRREKIVESVLTDGQLDLWASDNWPQMLALLLDGSKTMMATVILPLPPADVAATLVKAAGTGYALKVAAEPGAIAFKERMSELRARANAERTAEEVRQRALAADPIIYAEKGSASAIIAQFGDFPIERAVVDAVIAAGDFIPETRVEVSPASYIGSEQWIDVMGRQLQTNALRQVSLEQLRQSSLGQMQQMGLIRLGSNRLFSGD